MRRFDGHDLTKLQYQRSRITGEPVPLIAVIRSGRSHRQLDATFRAEDLLMAWGLKKRSDDEAAA
jgi:hypothetical protein